MPEERLELDELLSPEEAQSKIAIMLANTENLETLSELNEDEVKLVSALITISKEFKIGLLDNYLAKFLQLKVSLHRQGRREISDIARPSQAEQEKTKQSLKSMLLGGL